MDFIDDDDDDEDDDDDGDLLVPGAPDALQRAFRENGIDPTQEGQVLDLWFIEFTRDEAQFLVDFLRRNPLAVGTVQFNDCGFDSKDGCLDILKVYFAATMGLTVCVGFDDNSMMMADWLPSVIAFTTFLDLSDCSLDDANFKRVVDIILGGNAKKILRALNVGNNRISSNGLVDVERLVEHSQLEYLELDENDGILDNQERVQSLCDKLKINKSLCLVSFYCCGASEATASATTTMFVDTVFPVYTTLTGVSLQQNPYPYSENDVINEHRLEPWTIRNYRLSSVLTGVQGLLLANNNNINHQQNNEMDPENHIVIAHEKIWRHIVNAAMEDVDRDKSALFLLMRNAIVGHDACPLHEKVVEALKESARAQEQQESPSEEALQAKIFESLQADNVLLQAENDSLHAKVESLQVANESLQQRLVAMQAEKDANIHE